MIARLRGHPAVHLVILALAAAGCGGSAGSSQPSAPTTFTISGTIAGAAGVTVALSGASSATTTTDAAGRYAFAGLSSGSYTVTPSLAGYVFNPLSTSVTVSGASLSGKDFAGAANPSPHGISGTVSGLVAAGVTVALSGANTGTTTTDGAGHYAFTGLADGSYTVTASRAGYVFAPAGQAVVLSGADITQDFTDVGAYAISGTVSGLVASGVTVTLSGAASAATTTDGSGHYAFTGLADGSYTVAASKGGGYVFSPATQAVTVSGASATQNFTAGGAYAISGTISGLVTSGVTVTLSGAASATTTSDGSGRYTFAGLASGSYTVAASKAGGYAFSPASPAVVLSGASAGQDFSATGAYGIFGVVSGLSAPGVTVTLSGAANATTTTDAGGTYSFLGLANGSYTVTPSKAGGYLFAPTSQAVAVSGSNASANFTDTGAYSISGTVSGLASAGVTVTLSGAASATTTTAGNGSYAFTGLANGSYTVTPSLTGYVFTPPGNAVAVSGGNAVQDFVSAVKTYEISGTVTGGPPGAVTVRLAGASTATTTTDLSGNYAFSGLLDGSSYTVTPSVSGYSFTPPSSPVTITAADASAGFDASLTGAGLFTFNGKVAYAGSKTGRVYVTVGWTGQGSDSGGGTSLAAPGTFAIRGVQAGMLPGSVDVTVWMDTLGIGAYVPSADPAVRTTLGGISSSPVALGTLTLVDPGAIVPAAPQVQGALPADQAAAVIYKAPTDGNGNALGDHFNIYWSKTSSSPGPASNDGVLGVPAGAGFGIVRGLANGSAYWFSVSTVAGGNESAPAVLGQPVTIGQPAGAYTITGTVAFPALPPGANAVYVVAQMGQNGQPFVVRLPNPTSPQPFSLPVNATGTYQLFAFVDVGDDGVVGVGEPSPAGNNAAVGVTVTVSGPTTAAPPLSIPAANVLATVTTSHQVYPAMGGPQVNDSLQFGFDTYWKLPVAAQLIAGPNVIPPLDIGVSSNGGSRLELRRWWSLWPATPMVGDAYTVHVTYSDGSSEDLVLTVTAYLTSLPAVVSPADGATGASRTPTFAWSAPAFPPALFTYGIDVWPGAGASGGWNSDSIPSGQTSIAYDADGRAAAPTLDPSASYQWQIRVQDAAGNSASSQASFTTGP